MVVSNRGPVSFVETADGDLKARRGAGGLVSGLAPLLVDSGHLWIGAALSDADRKAAARGVLDADGFTYRAVDLSDEVFDGYYDTISNATLWFTHHGLFESAVRPELDLDWDDAWQHYRTANLAFADTIAESAPPDATVLVQDLHLSLVPRMLANLRTDLTVVHFSHTPFATPHELAVLPRSARTALLEGLAAADACGFHSARWAEDFTRCLAADAIDPPKTFVAPLGPDPADLPAVADTEGSRAAHDRLDAELGDRRLLLRVDRIELSKNIVRGFRAFEALLRRRADLRETVVFGAFIYPSREGVAEYARYREEIDRTVAEVNDRFATPDWTPILLDTDDDFPRSVAALRRADVLLVNPIRDGMNLVAKEITLVNERDAVLALSRGAGAWDDLGEAAIEVEPYHLDRTADALAEALDLEPHDRAQRFARLRELAGRHTPTTWLAAQLAAGGDPNPPFSTQ